MRPFVRLAALLSLLAACQMHAPGAGPTAGDVAPLASEVIAVTPLDAAPAVQAPDTTAPHPEAKPQDAATAEPVAPVSPEQTLCEASNGQWSTMAESSGHVCVHPTRDSGKSCHRKGDCQGDCLAQSGTCSPITPLMGCNAILQADGTEVTLCLQ